MTDHKVVWRWERICSKRRPVHTVTRCPLAVVDGSRMVLWGGEMPSGEHSAVVSAFDPTLGLNRWHDYTVKDDYNGPPPAWSACGALLRAANAFVVTHATNRFNDFDDVWLFDLCKRSWTRLQIDGERPAARHCSVCESANSLRFAPLNRFFLFQFREWWLSMIMNV